MNGLGIVQIITLSAVAIVALAGLRVILRREPDRVIRRILVAGVLAKIAGAVAFYWFVTDVFGRGDSLRYFNEGIQIAPTIRSGSLPPQAYEPGTPFMEFLTGLVIAGTGSSLPAVYAVFTLLSLSGLFLFLQAFRMSVPDGNHRRYAVLILLVPTLVFWTSNLSKEAWLVFCLGVGAYGMARLLRGYYTGLALAALGIAGVYSIRPHMAALFTLSFAVAYLIRVRDRTPRWGIAGWVVGLVLVAAGTGYVALNYGDAMQVGPSEERTGINRLLDGTDELLTQTEERTQRGVSQFDSRPVEGPGDFLYALVTVPFRPFPHEAHNATALLASLEGIFLIGLFALAAPRLWRLPRHLLRYPFVAGVFVYILGFILAFANVSNFGLLVRQRAQLLPFLLVLLALPRTVRQVRGRSRQPMIVAAPEPTSTTLRA